MKHLFTTLLIISFSLNAISQIRGGYTLPRDSSTQSITAMLNIPFGTIAKLEVEIFDGNSLHMKATQSIYLLKVNSVNNRIIGDTLLLSFTDETQSLANDDFSLAKLIYGKPLNSLTDIQYSKMTKKYVGKKITMMAYETGGFTGIPDKYFDYRPAKADLSFHFRHYLVVVSVIKK
jgi:hypothetical protein